MKKLMMAMVLCLVCTMFLSCEKECVCTHTNIATGAVEVVDTLVSHNITQPNEFCKAISYKNDKMVVECE